MFFFLFQPLEFRFRIIYKLNSTNYTCMDYCNYETNTAGNFLPYESRGRIKFYLNKKLILNVSLEIYLTVLTKISLK